MYAPLHWQRFDNNCISETSSWLSLKWPTQMTWQEHPFIGQHLLPLWRYIYFISQSQLSIKKTCSSLHNMTDGPLLLLLFYAPGWKKIMRDEIAEYLWRWTGYENLNRFHIYQVSVNLNCWISISELWGNCPLGQIICMLSILVVKRYLHQSFTTSRAFFAGLAVIHSIQPLDLSDWGPNWMFDVIQQQVLEWDITYKLHVVDIW